MYYDSHAHPNIEPLFNELDEIILEAKNNKLKFNIVGIDLETSKTAIRIAKNNLAFIKACIGIHPNDVQKFDYEIAKNELKKLCDENLNVISAIGECGLDFYYSIEHKDLQYKFLKMQMNLAIKKNIPLMLHVRNAHIEMINFLKEYKPNIPIIFHCFSENIEIAWKLINLRNILNIYLSIPGIVTFKNALELQEAVKIIPLNMMLVETDSPWLTPVPHRGKMNRPLYVKYTIDKIAKLKQKNSSEVAFVTYENAIKIFRK